MVAAVTLDLIAFIIIFIEVGGYSNVSLLCTTYVHLILFAELLPSLNLWKCTYMYLCQVHVEFCLLNLLIFQRCFG